MTDDGARAASSHAWLALAIAVIGVGGEALLWIAIGRTVPALVLLGAACGLGLVGALIARLSRRATLGVAIGFGLPLVPQLENVLGRVGAPDGSTLLLASAFAVGVGAVAVVLARMRWIRWLAAGAAVATAGALLASSAPGVTRPSLGAAGAHPDVLVVVMDTTRRDRLSLYGHDVRTTPALERLAERARVYDDAWSAAPWTPPSHATLFTGLLPAEHGVDGVHVPAFPVTLPSLPDRLQRAGFATAGLVANPNLLGPGWSRGFDVYAPPWYEGPHSLVAWLNRVVTKGRPAWLDDEGSDRILDRARRWWVGNEGAPRFLFMNFVDPHDPYRPLERDRARIQPELMREDAFAVPQDPQRYAIDPGIDDDVRSAIAGLYDAEIAGLDRRLGVFFDWLEARGELDSTLIVVTSDHGERLGERGLLGHLLVMDQHLLRVPLVLRYPPAISPERVPERVSLQGVANEVLALVGLEALPAPSGPGLSAAVAGSRSELGTAPVVAQHGRFGWYVDQLRGRDAAFESAHPVAHWTLVAEGDRALMWSPDLDESPVVVALEGDPSWQDDLADVEPARRDALLEVARAAPRYAEGEGEARAGEIDEATLERLRALGYAD